MIPQKAVDCNGGEFNKNKYRLSESQSYNRHLFFGSEPRCNEDLKSYEDQERAAEIAREAGYHNLNVISAVGTREYYRSQNFTDTPYYQQRPL